MDLDELRFNNDGNGKSYEIISTNKLYDILRDNFTQFAAGGVAGFLFGLGTKYVWNGGMINPIIQGAGVTPIVDVFEFTMIQGTRGNVIRTLQNDIGTFAGNTLGYTLASLL